MSKSKILDNVKVIPVTPHNNYKVDEWISITRLGKRTAELDERDIEINYKGNPYGVLWLLNLAVCEITKFIHDDELAFEKYKAEKNSDEAIETSEEQPF